MILVVFAVMLVVFDVTLVSNPDSAFVALIISAVILDVLDVILSLNPFSTFVALVISAVILAVFELMAIVFAVILDVLDAINVGSVPIVVELIPPTLFTVGISADPPKSFAKFITPFSVNVALVADIVPPEIDKPKPAVKATCFALKVV